MTADPVVEAAPSVAADMTPEEMLAAAEPAGAA